MDPPVVLACHCQNQTSQFGFPVLQGLETWPGWERGRGSMKTKSHSKGISITALQESKTESSPSSQRLRALLVRSDQMQETSTTLPTLVGDCAKVTKALLSYHAAVQALDGRIAQKISQHALFAQMLQLQR